MSQVCASNTSPFARALCLPSGSRKHSLSSIFNLLFDLLCPGDLLTPLLPRTQGADMSAQDNAGRTPAQVTKSPETKAFFAEAATNPAAYMRIPGDAVVGAPLVRSMKLQKRIAALNYALFN